MTIIPPGIAPLGSAAPDRYLLLRLGTRRCALPAAVVRELLPLPRLWRPPGLPRPLAGFLNLGGAAVPVLDLPRLLGLADPAGGAESALYRHLVLAAGVLPGQDLALLVDRVLDMMTAPASALRPLAPEQSLNGCASAEIETPEGFVHLLAPDRILLAQERSRLAALRDAEQARLAEWDGAV